VGDLERERSAMSLLGDVLIELSRRDSVRRVLRTLAGIGSAQVVRELADDFERALNERFPAQESVKDTPAELPGAAAGGEQRGGDHTNSSSPGVSFPSAPAAREAPPVEVAASATPPPEKEKAPAPAGEAPAVRSAAEEPVPIREESSTAKPAAGDAPERPLEIEGPLPLGHPHEARIAVELSEGDHLYIHGVSAIPLEERPAARPFVLQEKGIDGREFAFALDRGGLRFYCSKMTARAANVSKAGMLLLGKQESVHLRGVHEGILNELRQHGVLLPFAFGSVTLGRDDLFDKIDAHLYDLRDAVDEQMAPSWWNLSAFMLDAKLAQMLGDEPTSSARDRERPRSTASVPGPSPRIGIKTLERILGRQKKIAESIHDELKKYAQRADVDMMVGFNSGTSDEWKLILKSSYEVRPSGIQAFNRAITSIQYRHFLFELMLSLDGDREPFSFQRQ
jgi:hypothetical protein